MNSNVISYDFRLASRDTIYGAVYGVITRMLQAVETGLNTLPGYTDHGSLTHSGYLTSLTPGGVAPGSGHPSEMTWQINIEATALKGDTGVEVSMNATGPYRSHAHKKVSYGGFTDSKDMAKEILRECQTLLAQLKVT